MGVKGKNGHVPEGAGFFAVHFRADGLGRVLDDQKAAPAGQFHDGGHVGHVAVKVHHHYGAGPGGQNFFDAGGRDHAGVRVHVRPDDARAFFGIGIGRRRKGVRGQNHLVPRLETAELGGHFQSGDAVHGGEAGAPRHALIVRELVLKSLKVSALGQGIGVAHGLDDHGDFFFGIFDGAAAEIDFDVHRILFVDDE